jgi:hypothetical protein
MEKGASSPFAQAKRTDFQILRKGAARPFSIGRIFTAKAQRRKANAPYFSPFSKLNHHNPSLASLRLCGSKIFPFGQVAPGLLRFSITHPKSCG